MYFFQDKDISLSGEHVREGLTCVVSVRVRNPEFEGQTKVLFQNYVNLNVCVVVLASLYCDYICFLLYIVCLTFLSILPIRPGWEILKCEK